MHGLAPQFGSLYVTTQPLVSHINAQAKVSVCDVVVEVVDGDGVVDEVVVVLIVVEVVLVVDEVVLEVEVVVVVPPQDPT